MCHDIENVVAQSRRTTPQRAVLSDLKRATIRDTLVARYFRDLSPGKSNTILSKRRTLWQKNYQLESIKKLK